MKWAFLDANPQREDFTLRQVRLTLTRQGHSVGHLRVIDGLKLKTPDEIDRILKRWKPDRILWCSITGLPYYELWIQPFWSSIPKIILWFDEPITAVEQYGLERIMRGTANRPDFFYGIWDGYWREEAQKRWGIQAYPIHLSIDEKEYRPFVRPPSSTNIKIGEKEVVFIGMLHSAQSISESLKSLPRGLSALGRVVQSRLEQEIACSARGLPTNLIPCGKQLWRDAIQELREKEKILIQTECQRDRTAMKNLRWAIWAMAKNAFRIQILRKTLEVSPLSIFCEQKQLSHAGETELRELLPEQGSRLRMIDTSDWNSEDLGYLHHYGLLQIQATDPQSVQGGISYRVFQTAASGKALLTDLRPELEKCFELEKEILGYTSASDFIPALTAALANPEKLMEVGRAARVRFEREHTWNHRLATIEGWIRKS